MREQISAAAGGLLTNSLHARAQSKVDVCSRAQSDIYIYAMHALARYYYLATREWELEIGCLRRRNNYSRASSIWMQTANNNACVNRAAPHFAHLESRADFWRRALRLRDVWYGTRDWLFSRVLKRTDERARRALGLISACVIKRPRARCLSKSEAIISLPLMWWALCSHADE